MRGIFLHIAIILPSPWQPLAAAIFFNWVAKITSCPLPLYLSYTPLSSFATQCHWPRFTMTEALTHRRCYSLIAILDFSLCGALGLPCIWQMLSYVHELSYKPMICSSPSSPLTLIIINYNWLKIWTINSVEIFQRFPALVSRKGYKRMFKLSRKWTTKFVDWWTGNLFWHTCPTGGLCPTLGEYNW